MPNDLCGILLLSSSSECIADTYWELDASLFDYWLDLRDIKHSNRAAASAPATADCHLHRSTAVPHAVWARALSASVTLMQFQWLSTDLTDGGM